MTITLTGSTLYTYPRVHGSLQRIPNLKPAAVANAAFALVQVAIDGQPITPLGVMLTTPTVMIYEGQDVGTRARPVSEDGTTILQAHVDSTGLKLFDASSGTGPATLIHEEELDADEVFRTGLVLDGGWRIDTDGFSFYHRLEGDLGLFQGGRLYRAEYLVRTADFGPIPIVVPIQTRSLMSNPGEIG